MLLEIMPYVLGAAVSPVVLATTVVLLAQAQKPLQKTLAYLAGGTVMAAAVGGVIFFAAHARATSGKPSLSDSIIHIVLGVILLILAVKIWRKPNKSTKKTSAKKIHYSRDFLLGMVLMGSNFTSLIMFVPAGLELQTAADSVRLTGYLLLVLAATLAIWLPLLLVIVMGKRGQKLLKLLSGFMARHGQQVSGGMIGAIALYVLYRGLSGL